MTSARAGTGRSRARSRGALVWTVARRMLLREGRAGRGRVWIVGVVLVAIVALGVLLVLLGVRSVIPPLAAGVAALGLLGAACVRTLTPAVAVAVFGMGLGVAALVTVLGVTSGFEHELTARLARINGHLLLLEYGHHFDEYPDVLARCPEYPRVVTASPSPDARRRDRPSTGGPPDDLGYELTVTFPTRSGAVARRHASHRGSPPDQCPGTRPALERWLGW